MELPLPTFSLPHDDVASLRKCAVRGYQPDDPCLAREIARRFHLGGLEAEILDSTVDRLLPGRSDGRAAARHRLAWGDHLCVLGVELRDGYGDSDAAAGRAAPTPTRAIAIR